MRFKKNEEMRKREKRVKKEERGKRIWMKKLKEMEIENEEEI